MNEMLKSLTGSGPVPPGSVSRIALFTAAPDPDRAIYGEFPPGPLSPAWSAPYSHGLMSRKDAVDAAVADYIVAAPREAQEKRGKITVRPSGKYVNPLKMRSRDICIEDIAHHLSLVCRYTGACPYHYSVAQHSVLVSRRLQQTGATAELQMAGLLHDAGEYVFNDLASPVKHDPRMKWYADLEHETTRMIMAVFGVNPDLLPDTKPADDFVFRAECRHWWGGGHGFRGGIAIGSWSHQWAERQFLFRFNQLKAVL
jgi:uncharacterized protein